MTLFVRRRSFGIQARLTMVAVATALPLVALASFAVLRTVDDRMLQLLPEARLSQMSHDRSEPLGSLRVVRAGVVSEKAFVVN